MSNEVAIKLLENNTYLHRTLATEKVKTKQAKTFGISLYKFQNLFKHYGTDYNTVKEIVNEMKCPEKPSVLYYIFEKNIQSFPIEDFEYAIKNESKSLFDILFIINTIKIKDPSSRVYSIFQSLPFIKSFMEPIGLDEVFNADVPKSKLYLFNIFKEELLTLIEQPECISVLSNDARYYINQYLALGFLHGKVELSDSNHHGGILSPHLKGQFLSVTKKLQSNTLNIGDQKLNSKYEVGFKNVLQWLSQNNQLYENYKDITNDRIVEIFQERAEGRISSEVPPQPGLQRAQNQGMISVVNPSLTTDFDDGSKSSLLIPVRVAGQEGVLYLTLEKCFTFIFPDFISLWLC